MNEKNSEKDTAHADPDRRSDHSRTERGVSVHNLTVKAGTRTLLQDTNAEFSSEQITIIVGPSGVGKSILMRIIAGLLGSKGKDGIHFQGQVQVDGSPVKPGSVGVVFQSFALFDELSPKANVAFASDHSRGKRIASEKLLEQLNVPKDVPTSRLSGGQRQRLAIARSLAFNPPVILYDEPTSGLDPSTGRQVASLIRDTHNEYQKTSIIVTHDYETLVPIADRVIVLDPSKQELREVPREQWEQLEKLLAPMATTVNEKADQDANRQSPRWAQWLSGFFEGTTRCLEAFLIGLLSLLPVWRSPKWGLRYLAHYARLVAGPTAWFYLIMAGVIVGFVTTHFTFQFLPYAKYTEPLLDDNLLLAIGFTLYRIFVPIIATVLIAARCGAAVTSDVGGKQFGNQNDALLTFGTTSRSYLFTPIMISFLIGTPILTLIAFFAAKYTSLIAYVTTHPVQGPDYWDSMFHQKLRVLGETFYYGTGWLLFKLVCCGFGTGVISYYQGIRNKNSTSDVSRSVTATILWATLYVLAVHFAFAFFEFEAIE